MILTKLQEALVEIAAQRRALDEVEAQLRSMIARLSGVPDVSATVSRSATPIKTERERDKLDDIADILKSEGQPLHITVIAERLSALYGKTVDRTEIEPGINRHIAKVKQRRIDKFGPSTFGLPEWKTQPTLAQIA